MNTTPSSPWSAAGNAVLRAVLALAGLVLMAVALLMGLVVATCVVLWALLRGRRPAPVNLRWQTVRRPGAFRRASTGEVVDVQAREVVDPVDPPAR